jgi:hypothetical protein
MRVPAEFLLHVVRNSLRIQQLDKKYKTQVIITRVAGWTLALGAVGSMVTILKPNIVEEIASQIALVLPATCFVAGCFFLARSRKERLRLAGQISNSSEALKRFGWLISEDGTAVYPINLDPALYPSDPANYDHSLFLNPLFERTYDVPKGFLSRDIPSTAPWKNNQLVEGQTKENTTR